MSFIPSPINVIVWGDIKRYVLIISELPYKDAVALVVHVDDPAVRDIAEDVKLKAG